jgi:hypothetical protein
MSGQGLKRSYVVRHRIWLEWNHQNVNDTTPHALLRGSGTLLSISVGSGTTALVHEATTGLAKDQENAQQTGHLSTTSYSAGESCASSKEGILYLDINCIRIH